ncbi:MAG: hypothetical protein DRJ38_08210 [Thermoprotei archaeon]|nr:MAG: hypothetical protein DRJ38_08210 [Thermoprotei archaeon]
MNEIVRKILELLNYAMTVMGISFTMLSIWMTIFKIGRNPLTALAIGMAFFAGAYVIQKLAYKTCPRCGSILIENGRCQVCDYELSRER